MKKTGSKEVNGSKGSGTGIVRNVDRKEGIWVQLKQAKGMLLQSEKQIHREKNMYSDIRKKY